MLFSFILFFILVIPGRFKLHLSTINYLIVRPLDPPRGNTPFPFEYGIVHVECDVCVVVMSMETKWLVSCVHKFDDRDL